MEKCILKPTEISKKIGLMVNYITNQHKYKPYEKENLYREFFSGIDPYDFDQIKKLREEFCNRDYKKIGRSSSVYLIFDEDENFYKIGCSDNPTERLKSIARDRGRTTNYPKGQQSERLNLELVVEFKGLNYFDEFFFHVFFREYRLNVGEGKKLTEWFNLPIVKTIKFMSNYAEFFGTSIIYPTVVKETPSDSTNLLLNLQYSNNTPSEISEYINYQRDNHLKLITNHKQIKKGSDAIWNEYISILPLSDCDFIFINGLYHGIRWLEVCEEPRCNKYIKFVSTHTFVTKRKHDSNPLHKKFPSPKNDFKIFKNLTSKKR
jgi:hypothetical protein